MAEPPPAGQGNYEARLGERGAELIRAFVRGGGGFVGICAGAYLGSAEGLGLLPVGIGSVHDCDRGRGACDLSFTPEGRALLGAAQGRCAVRFADGPALQLPAEGDAVLTLARFETGFFGNGHCTPICVGDPAEVYGRGGGGGVVLTSPHLEDGAVEASRSPFRNIFRLVAARRRQ